MLLPSASDVGDGSLAAFLAARVSAGGCSTSKASGVFFWIDTSGTWTISSNLGMRRLYSYQLCIIFYSW